MPNKVNITTHIPEHDPAIKVIREYSKMTGTPIAQIARDALRAYASETLTRLLARTEASKPKVVMSLFGQETEGFTAETFISPEVRKFMLTGNPIPGKSMEESVALARKEIAEDTDLREAMLERHEP